MADTQPPRVDNEIVQMWRKDGRLYAIAGFIAGVMLFPLLASLGENLAGFLQELAPEAVGILVTVFLIDRIIQRRDERNAEEALKQRLVIDAGSQSNEKAKDAVHQLRKRGWLEGEKGFLKSVNLERANLQEVDLSGANLVNTQLHGARLDGADLRGAYLMGAVLFEALLDGADLRQAHLDNIVLIEAHLIGTTLDFVCLEGISLKSARLDGAKLRGAKLDGADLSLTNLSNAELFFAKLRGANLRSADLNGADLCSVYLEGAVLYEANLRNARLEDAQYDEKTLLPDENYWTPETDMNRFTDPNHPDFWEPDWVKRRRQQK